MPPRSRRNEDQVATRLRLPFLDGVVIAAAMAALAWLGSLLPSHNLIPPLWPVPAVMLGLLLRFPQFVHLWTWCSTIVALVAVQYLLGSPWMPALWMSIGVMVSIILGYVAFTQLGNQSKGLRTPVGILHLLLACMVASVVDGLLSAQLAYSLNAGSTSRNMLVWFGSSLVGYIAIVPIMMSLPASTLQPSQWRETWQERNLGAKHSLPLIVAVACAIAGWSLKGHGGAVYAAPALLWCAIHYSIFTSALLTGLVGLGFFLGQTQGWLGPATSALKIGDLLTEQMGLVALMLAPPLVGGAMEAKRELEKRLRVLSDFDQLTRLPLRSAFLQWGQKLLQHRFLQRLPVSVIVFDVDQLQRINETYGHETGDKVLSTLGRHLQHSLRRQDCVGRLGGEEFGVILCSQTEQDAQQVIERICLRFALLPITLEHGETLHCSITAGAVYAGRAPLSLASLLTQAQLAIRLAKQKGKGQWHMQLYVPSQDESQGKKSRYPSSALPADAKQQISRLNGPTSILPSDSKHRRKQSV